MRPRVRERHLRCGVRIQARGTVPNSAASPLSGVVVQSEAPSLTLFIDGRRIGSLPREMSNLEPGTHVVSINGGDLFDSWEQTVAVLEGEVLELQPELALRAGKLHVTLSDSARDARVTLVGN